MCTHGLNEYEPCDICDNVVIPLLPKELGHCGMGKGGGVMKYRIVVSRWKTFTAEVEIEASSEIEAKSIANDNLASYLDGGEYDVDEWEEEEVVSVQKLSGVRP